MTCRNPAVVKDTLARFQAKPETEANRKKLLKEVRPLMTDIRTLVAVKSRRRKDEREMVGREEYGRFARAALIAVATHVPEHDRKVKIQQEVLTLLGLATSPALNGAA